MDELLKKIEDLIHHEMREAQKEKRTDDTKRLTQLLVLFGGSFEGAEEDEKTAGGEEE